MYWAVSCIYTNWRIDSHVLCTLCQGCKDSASLFCWQMTSPGPGAAVVLQSALDLLSGSAGCFLGFCFKLCLYFHTVNLPLLCALKPQWLLKCSVWGCTVTTASKTGQAVLPPWLLGTAEEFFELLWLGFWSDWSSFAWVKLRSPSLPSGAIGSDEVLLKIWVLLPENVL